MTVVQTIERPTVYSLTRPLQHVRAGDLANKRDAFGVFASQPSAQAITVAATALVAARVGLGEAGRGEVIAPLVSATLTGPVVRVVHRHALHPPTDAARSRLGGLGAGHRRHHASPTELRWLLLSGGEAVLAVVALGLFSALWSVPLAGLIGAPTVATFLTAWVCATLCLLHDEWVHLLVHTRYRPRTGYYTRLARHHRLHHRRVEHSWLGITSPLGDRLLRIAPRTVDRTHRLGNG